MAQSEQTVGWENSSKNLRLVDGEDKNGLRFFGSRYRLGEKIPKTAKTGMIWVSNYDVVEDFNF